MVVTLDPKLTFNDLWVCWNLNGVYKLADVIEVPVTVVRISLHILKKRQNVAPPTRAISIVMIFFIRREPRGRSLSAKSLFFNEELKTCLP
mgnify:CR=1 FL=1